LRPAPKQDPISKIPNTKRAGGVAQVALLSKSEALSSNLSTAKKKKK
jgi:hypothetical protein